MHADMQSTWADVSKVDRLLDWQPVVSLAEGLTQSWIGTGKISPSRLKSGR